MNDLIARLRKLRTSADTEAAHLDADELLCEALERHGEHELVVAFHAIRKHYA